MDIEEEVARRRTFAIISHPDAGKTTMTEKLLLFGGAIQMAGTVRARKADRHATSDWMKLEQERGISVTTSVMQFPFANHVVNLLDTPGHQDFSEDTYRTLTAVDSALMMIDAARGVQSQTVKLLEVCRMRTTPIMTFINKLDREGRDPLDLMAEIEEIMGVTCIPFSWPIGIGRDFQGVYNLHRDRLELFRGGEHAVPEEIVSVEDIDDDQIDELIGLEAADALREEVMLVREAGDAFDLKKYLNGEQTPVFFGSALNNFGVKEYLDCLVELAPRPRHTMTTTREVETNEGKVSGFVFKIQANMDPAHRDRIAFMRVCSGTFKKGMRLHQVRTGSQIRMHNPITFMAQERSIVETAFAGDIVGLHDKGAIQVGDTFTEGEQFQVTGIPHFAPELFRKVRLKNPLASKALHKGLVHLGEEGAAQVFKRQLGNEVIVGAVGSLQFEVVAHRLQHEYNVDCSWEAVSYTCCRWLHGDQNQIDKLARLYPQNLATDARGHLVFMADGLYQINSIGERYDDVRFSKTMEMTASK
ncbi:MAG: peptide chain release factor 3 [Myxococcales bacterium]|nr:peptide chain release factor 3 [Myxococcales bacterium]